MKDLITYTLLALSIVISLNALDQAWFLRKFINENMFIEPFNFSGCMQPTNSGGIQDAEDNCIQQLDVYVARRVLRDGYDAPYLGKPILQQFKEWE